ncbi:MAG: cupin domain-containing protein [Candidatus Marinimicrobia bacterium]|nr:cupin domain-containing protein [Candidatus Neomarinimicrobiota bacterium]
MKHRTLSAVKKDIRKDYTKRVIFNAEELPEGGHMLQEVTILPHTRQRAHTHEAQTEIFFVLEGGSELHINGEQFRAEPGDAFVCSPGEVHFLHNRSAEPFRLLVIKINRPADHEDSVWMEEKGGSGQ